MGQPVTDRKKVYNGVLQTILANVAENQPPGMARVHLLGNRNRANYDQEQTRKAIQALLENKEIMEWYGPGHKLYYVPITKKCLRRVINIEARSDDPNKSIIGKCNRMLHENV